MYTKFHGAIADWLKCIKLWIPKEKFSLDVAFFLIRKCFPFCFSDVKIDVPDKFGFSGLMQASQKGYYE